MIFLNDLKLFLQYLKYINSINLLYKCQISIIGIKQQIQSKVYSQQISEFNQSIHKMEDYIEGSWRKDTYHMA